MKSFGIAGIFVAVGLLATGLFGNATAQTSDGGDKDLVILVPDDISAADREAIAENVQRFFSGGISIGTPLGSVTISIRSAADAPKGARSAEVSSFANRSASDVSRNFICKALCNTVAAAAAAACAGAPPVLAACLAAVAAARDECLRRC